MKKQAKILTFALVLALLVGAFAVYSSAATGTDTALTGDGIRKWGAPNYDFESTNFDKHYSTEDGLPFGWYSQDIVDATKFSHYSSKCSCHNDLVSKCENLKNGTAVANRYGSFWAEKKDNNQASSATNTNSNYVDLFEKDYELEKNQIGNLSYQVWDLDLTSDRYIDQNGSLTTFKYTDSEGKPTDKAKDADGNDNTVNPLAFNEDSTGFGFFERGKASTVSTNNFQFDCSSEGNYIVIKGKRVRLDIDAGEWFHLTVVFAFDRENINNSKAYYYIDGEYVTSSAAISSSNETTAISGIRVYDKTAAQYIASPISYSNCWDNVTLHYYDLDYNGAMSRVFSPTSHPDSIGDLSDMLYNGAYQYPDPNEPIATVTQQDNTPAKYYLINGALDAIEEGCTLTLAEGVSGIEYEASVDFRVACSDPADFTVLGVKKVATWVDDGSFKGYVIADPPESSIINIAYYDSADSETRLPVDEGIDETALVNRYISPLSHGADWIRTVVNNGLEIKRAAAWEASYLDAEGVRQSFNISEPVTEAVAAAVNSYNDGVIRVYPVWDIQVLAYTITDGADNILTLDGSYDYLHVGSDRNFAEDINSVLGNSSSLSGITVKLYSDITVTSGTTINLTSAIKADKALRFDLNGYRYLNYRCGANSYLFSLNGSELYVYSSRPGGEIITTSYNDGVANRGYFAGFNSTNNKLHLGRYGDIDGDNLSVYASVFVDNTGRVGATSPNEILIDGGSYAKVGGGMSAIFVLRSRTYVEIKNAKVFSTEKYSSYLMITAPNESAYKNASVNMVIDNSEIRADDGFSTAALYENTSSVKITNSTIYASLSKLNKISEDDTSYVELGEGAKIVEAKGSMGNAVRFADGTCLSAKAYGNYTFDLPYYDIKYDTADDGTVTLNTDSVSVKKQYALSPKVNTHVVPVRDAVKDLAKVNLTTDNGFFFNLYLPESFGAKVYLDPECTNEAIGVATEFGMRYTAAAISPAHIEAVTFYVKALDGNGKLTEAVSVYGMTLAEYYTAVLEGDYTDLEKKLVVNAANYCEEVYKFVNNGTSSGAYDGILTAANLTLTEYDKAELEEDAKNVSISTLTDYIHGATISINEGNCPVFTFVMQDGVTNELSIATYSLKYDALKTHLATPAGEYALCSGDYGIYDLVTDMTVTVDGNVGTYNIAAYISSLADDAEGRELAEAMYAYSLVSREYVTTAE